MLVFATLVALLVGLVLALESSLGAMGATFTVAGGGLLVAVILLLLAKNCITRMRKAIAS